ncbi:hypothetical protein BCR33DRAFT_723468 [Rhizoclosmatium globosum]|uniref:Uncharacterized protein n=1 Tax=Rhizoclosmatium globosum TaxID=329046 RepID=A0A1Y2BC85_9FUNG|nr:hypothetical protein BCR33DRAFT_723468 [Rhizoclosmatium globosum]|eukprot:ORY32439.1 hypothetical protein BCR33DRAFT_723468 [Rhizoclosmatium globosum]
MPFSAIDKSLEMVRESSMGIGEQCRGRQLTEKTRLVPESDEDCDSLEAIVS